MDESDKLPLKRVELSLSKFNEVAIPHHLDLLRQHRANIIKYSERGEYVRVRGEQTSARRVCGQLRALLGELSALRGRVRAADRPAFDRAARRSADRTLKAITDYLETSPLADNRWEGEGVSGSLVSSESVGVLPDPEAGPELLQLQVDEQELSLRQREDVLRGWSALQDEVRALHRTWSLLHGAAAAQRDPVDASAARVEEAAGHVEAARHHLSLAERLRGGGVAWGGACVGLLAGGPAGLALGAKAGAAAALAGSLLGYLGGRAAARASPPAPGGDKCDKVD